MLWDLASGSYGCASGIVVVGWRSAVDVCFGRLELGERCTVSFPILSELVHREDMLGREGHVTVEMLHSGNLVS